MNGTETAMTVEQIEARTAEVDAEIKQAEQEKKAIERELASLRRESMRLAEQRVATWGPNPSPEQLLSLCGTERVRSIVAERVDTLARRHNIRQVGYSTVLRKGIYHPVAFGFDAWITNSTDLSDMAEAFVDIADALRIGEEPNNFHLYYRDDRATDLDVGLENGKIQHYLVIHADGSAKVLQYWRGNDEKVIASGTPAEALARAVDLAYSGALPI